MTAINAVADYCVEDGVAVLTLDSPPVNALGHEVRKGIAAGLERAFADPEVIALVLVCGGRTFFAGADINEFGKLLDSPVLREIALIMEGGQIPIIAAIHGTALGGGLEMALACHWRIAMPQAKLGLPEVKLGLLAGAGGTQRLPRLVGAARALEMVVNGDPINAREALECGLIDALAQGDLREDAVRFACQVAASATPRQRVRDMPPPVAAASLFCDFRSMHAERLRGFEAPEASIRCIEAAVAEPFEEGMRIERSLFEGLMAGTQCTAQRYIFFGEREAAKVPGLRKETKALPLEVVGIDGDPVLAREVADKLRSAGVEPSTPVPGYMTLNLGLLRSYTAGAQPAGSEDLVTACFAPMVATAGVLEILRRPETSDAALASALKLAKHLGIASVVTLKGDRLIGQRLHDRLAEAVRYCVGDGLPEADIVATALAYGLSLAAVGAIAEGGRPMVGEAAQAVMERLVVPMIDEGARLLEEGAAARGSDIDIVCVKSGLFKAYRGGPMFQAGQIGLFRVIDVLIEHQQRWGQAHRPSPLLEHVARRGAALHEYKGAIHG